METDSIIYIHFFPLFFAITFTYHEVETWTSALLTMDARKLILQIFEMSGCAPIFGSLHITIKMAVLIETPKALVSNLSWCSCKILSTQDHTVVAITHYESAAVFSLNGESLE